MGTSELLVFLPPHEICKTLLHCRLAGDASTYPQEQRKYSICEDLQSVGDNLEGKWLIARQEIETADFATTMIDPSEDSVTSYAVQLEVGATCSV